MSIKDHIIQHFSSIEDFATKLQEEALVARKKLFFDPILGFDYAGAGVRTSASVNDIEAALYKSSLGLIKFTLASHRHLLINICDGPAININCPKEYSSSNINDSKENNPYLKISKVLTYQIKEVMNKQIAKQKGCIQDVASSTQSVTMSSNIKKMSADEAIKIMTTSVISAIGDKNPMVSILSFYGHKVEDIVSDITNNVLTCKVDSEYIVISNAIGLSMQIEVTGKSDEAISEEVSKALSALLISSLIDSSLSDKVSTHIDVDSVKGLVTSSASTFTSTSKIPPINPSVPQKKQKSTAVKADVSSTSSPDFIEKFNRNVIYDKKKIEAEVVIDGITEKPFIKKLGGKLQSCARNAGRLNDNGLKTLYPYLSLSNRKYIHDLFDTCNIPFPFAA